MPTVMTHALVGAGLGVLFTARRMPLCFWLATAGLAMLPDLDVVVQRALGLGYGTELSHRGFTHSLVFAFLSAATAALLLGKHLGVRRLDLCGFLFLVTASHGLLDACTNGGSGIAFFAPFDNSRYFLPWRPIQVSPIGFAFFSRRGWPVLESEMRWVWLPTLGIVGPVVVYRWFRSRLGRR